jgi:hypothetical protein
VLGGSTLADISQIDLIPNLISLLDSDVTSWSNRNGYFQYVASLSESSDLVLNFSGKFSGKDMSAHPNECDKKLAVEVPPRNAKMLDFSKETRFLSASTHDIHKNRQIHSGNEPHGQNTAGNGLSR